VLGIHIKALRNFGRTFFLSCSFAGNREIRVFLKISIQVFKLCMLCITGK